jgi:dienelactone hydrolase
MCIPEEPQEAYKTTSYLRPAETAASAENGEVVIERVPFTFHGTTYTHSHIAYRKGAPPAPLVLVHPNYAGLKQFDIDQAAFLAKAGYVGFALDLYKDVEGSYEYGDRNPEPDFQTDAGKARGRKHFVGAFTAMNDHLRNPGPWRDLMSGYLALARKHPAVHPQLAAAIGYCFGGQCCLEQVRGGDRLDAIVTFHGLLHSRPTMEIKPGSPRMSPAEYADKVAVPSINPSFHMSRPTFLNKTIV